MVRTFDVLAPEVNEDPYPLFATMRREAPVCLVAPHQFWAVSRYQDVVSVMKQPDTFSSAGYDVLQRLASPGVKIWPVLPSLDPPAHTRKRSLVTKAFTPKIIARLEPRIRQIANEMLDKGVADGRIDLARDLAVPLPIIVIADLLGVKAERLDDFRRWARDRASLVGSYATDPAQVQRSTEEFLEYFTNEFEARRREPGDDLLSQLVHAEVDGSLLSTEELLGLVITLLAAGSETTSGLICNSIVSLLAHPDQMERVRRDPSLIPNAVEEVLRFMSPAQHQVRLATRDVEIHGVTIPKDAIVLPLSGSANRDESKFPEPDRFDVSRDCRGHLAFGVDIHFCIGASLARLEGRIALETILSRMHQLRHVEPRIAWAQSFMMRCPIRLPLAFSSPAHRGRAS